MALGAAVAVVAGAAAVGTAVYLIADHMTERERRRQERLTEQHYSNMSRLNSRRSSYHSDFNSSHRQLQAQYDAEYIAMIEQAKEEQREQLRAAWSPIKKALDEQLTERENRQKEIRKTITELYAMIQQNEQMLRKENLRHLALGLEETYEKITAYIRYLRAYEKAQLACIKRAAESLLPIFEMRLPKGYPYRGEVRFYAKSELMSGSFTQSIVEGFHPVKFAVTDSEMLSLFEDEVQIPVFVEGFVAAPNYENQVSISKGLFMQHINLATGVGLEVEVVRHERAYIEVSYGSMTMHLRKEDLGNPRLLPPRLSKIRVFPKEWNYHLSKPPFLSEKYQDSLANIHFDNIPLCFTSEAYYNVYLPESQKRELHAALGDWRFAPFDEQDLDGRFYRFQLSNELIMKVEFVQYGETYYFAFRSFLDESYQCKPTDIYISVSATLLLCDENNIVQIPSEAKKTMADLALFCTREFVRQQQVKQANSGLLYYNKWVMLIDQLITYKFKGRLKQEVRIAHASAPQKDRYSKVVQTTVEIENSEDVKRFLEQILEKKGGRTYFFMEDDDGNYHGVHILPNGERLFLYSELDIQQVDTITVYLKEIPYPEIQQLNALNRFRDGRITNEQIRQALLDGSYIEASTTPFSITKFFNPNIQTNVHQLNSVIHALEEDNIFLIQGPPGTGKTTVIQEIVLQYLVAHPSNRVLIVSQANVAVDNVLVDLYEGENAILPKERIIRCGQKVDNDLFEISFEQKYEKYIAEVKEIGESMDNQPLAHRWLQLIKADRRGYNIQLSELILKSHQVIGATCVGLANRNLGIDAMEFDLVIIDEASKALPGELLLPMNRAKKCIIIGDHHQLPPTIDSALLDQDKIEYEDREFIAEELFSRSLFEHLYVKAPDTNKSMLTTQYRMPPVLGTLISELFYEGKVENGVSKYAKQPKVFADHLNWLDLSDIASYREEAPKGKSPRNEYEASLVVDIALKIRQMSENRIAIITPYKGQKSCIRRAFLQKGIKDTSSLNIAYNTVDAFQGDEAEIVIFCTTRSQTPTSFFSDDARINVALSRCKNELLIIGSRKYFKKFGEDTKLSKICDYIEQNGTIFSEDTLMKMFQKADH